MPIVERRIAEFIPFPKILAWCQKQTSSSRIWNQAVESIFNDNEIFETLLYSMEWAAAGIGLHVNAHKTEYMCFN